jgi:hypothetical protein
VADGVQGTYYGAGGNGNRGACMISVGGPTVAINQAQWAGGSNCGKCVRITGQGAGAGANPIYGPIYAIIDNECPECKFGDIDMGLNGDGRWRITWDFVPCGKRLLRGGDMWCVHIRADPPLACLDPQADGVVPCAFVRGSGTPRRRTPTWSTGASSAGTARPRRS